MPAADPVRLLVVDDHTLFRRGLIALLAQEPALQVVGEAGDAGEAQHRAQALQPDVILLDNHLPGVTGIDALPGLREAAPRARVLMLTVSEDEHDLSAALKAGAAGYVLKNIEGAALVAAIHQIRKGQSAISPEMTGKLVAAFHAAHGSREGACAPPAPADPLAVLSPREQEILHGIASGLSNKAIARQLGIAETTVKVHVQHILRKLNLSSRVQAAVFLAGRGSA
ncbi:response regulator [Cupriavidus basilensis]|uniref:Nitrate/nitrite response regulator protein n=1 Tax=Cupriavidus basilensis TaxID=68895 RepID=A0A0C4YEG6_9BURK|nr:response regulator [Cupriavidus basilensis]AJG19186.1 Nitrate/nitrite response regulator protein [Cupriavidus basilensis]